MPISVEASPTAKKSSWRHFRRPRGEQEATTGEIGSTPQDNLGSVCTSHSSVPRQEKLLDQCG